MTDVKVDGNKLRALREVQDLTQGQLAIKAKVGQSHISRLELGQRPDAKVQTVAKLAHALGTHIDALLMGQGGDISDEPASMQVAIESIKGMRGLPEYYFDEVVRVVRLIHQDHRRKQQEQQ